MYVVYMYNCNDWDFIKGLLLFFIGFFDVFLFLDFFVFFVELCFFIVFIFLLSFFLDLMSFLFFVLLCFLGLFFLFIVLFNVDFIGFEDGFLGSVFNLKKELENVSD